MATTDSSNDDAPAPDDKPVARGTNPRVHRLLSASHERELFEIVALGHQAHERLSDSLACGIRARLQQVDQPPSPVNLEAEVIAKCCRNAVGRQALAQSGRIEFGESLSKSLHNCIFDVLETQERQFESAAVSWAEQICDQSAVQSAIPEDLWETADDWRLIAERERAFQEIVEHHQLLARSVAKSKQRNSNELEDLINEAALILRKAAEGFNPSLGVRFNSYAKKILMRELRRQRDAAMGLTRYSADQASVVERTQWQLGHQLGRPASSEEVHVLLGHNPITTREIENVRRLLLVERSSPPIDTPIKQCFDHRGEPDEFDDEERLARRQALSSAFRYLSWLDKRLVVGVEICGQSFRDLAKRYKKSHQTLSRRHKAAIELLAKRIDPNSNRSKPR